MKVRLDETLFKARAQENLSMTNDTNKLEQVDALVECLDHFVADRKWVDEISRDELLTMVTQSNGDKEVLIESVLAKFNTPCIDTKKLKECKERRQNNRVTESMKKRKSLKESDNRDTFTLDTSNTPILNCGLYYTLLGELNPGRYDERFKEFEECVKECAKPILDELVRETPNFEVVSVGNYYHPRYYNYETDSLEFTVKYTGNDLGTVIEEYSNNQDFIDFLQNYKSYDGFISFYADNKDDFVKQDYVKSVSQIIKYNVTEEEYDEANEDLYYDVMDCGFYPEDEDDTEESLKEKKYDIYVNDKYVASSDRHKRAKDVEDKIRKDGKIKYAGEKALRTSGVELDELNVGAEDKLKVKRARESKKLKEGYYGQTLQDFLDDCVDYSSIDKVYIYGNDDVVYEGPIDDIPEDMLETEFLECDMYTNRKSVVTVNVDSSKEYGAGTYEFLNEFLDDCNCELVVIYDLAEGEEIFSGYKEDIPEEYLEYAFASYDAPEEMSVNLNDYEGEDDFDESLKEEVSGKAKDFIKELKEFKQFQIDRIKEYNGYDYDDIDIDFGGQDYAVCVDELIDIAQFYDREFDNLTHTIVGKIQDCVKEKMSIFEIVDYLISDCKSEFNESLKESDDKEVEKLDTFDDQMDFLAKDEQEAIDGYKKVINKVSNAKVKSQLKKIETEEKAHKDYLNKVKKNKDLEYTEPLIERKGNKCCKGKCKKANESLERYHYARVLKKLAGRTITEHDLDACAKEIGMNGYRLWDVLKALVDDMYIINGEKHGEEYFKIPENAYDELPSELKENLKEDVSKSEFSDLLFDTILKNDKFKQLDVDKFNDDVDKPNEVDNKNGIIRLNYDNKYFEIKVNEIDESLKEVTGKKYFYDLTNDEKKEVLNVLTSIAEFVKGDKEISTYLYKYGYQSGSTETTPISIWNESGEVSIMLDPEINSATARKIINKIKKQFGTRELWVYYDKNDGSYPPEIVIKYLNDGKNENLKEADNLQTKATKMLSVKKYQIDMAWKNGKTWKTDPMTLDELSKLVGTKVTEKQFVDMMSDNIKSRKDAKNLTKAEIVKLYDYIDGKWKGKDVLWSIKGKTNENLKEDKSVDDFLKPMILSDTLERQPFISFAYEDQDGSTVVTTSWETTPRRAHNDYIKTRKFLGDKYNIYVLRQENRDDNKEFAYVMRITPKRVK